MALRCGAAYLDALRDEREVWYRGHRVADVTAEPGLARGAHTLADFLDRQGSAEHLQTLSFSEAPDGERFAMSFLMPRESGDVRRRGRAFYEWARWSNGMFGRTPDYKNASMTAFAGAADYLADDGHSAQFADNMREYYQTIRHRDLVLTHTLVNPQFNHALAREGRSSPEVALRIEKETDAGVVVSGARLLATLGPHADEIEVFPSTVLKSAPENIPYAIAFAIPVATPGLKLLCRDSYDHGKSGFDAPLASRFEEMDSVVLFDRVLVPWERVFMLKNPALCNRAFAETNAVVHMMHQVACGKLAKAEFIVGLLCAMAHASGKDSDMNVKVQIAEAMTTAETIRALLFAAEAQPEQDRWGMWHPQRRPLDTSRNLFPKLYPRLIELVQLLGSSSLMATPCEADFDNDIGSEVERYFQLTNLGSRDRVALFRLAHDVAISGFGGRQVLYERFFFGPQNLLASVYYDLYPRDEMMERVHEMLGTL
ncbi:MAG: 4-hydroxyphenylacetate 3-monooxygenase, oxygenase component [Gammaproteobacteria bacterium]|nr:4-hydroxyphenylacetate 3-monooxygenase, oxygenase component [Gammaproteobacteria bacterium]